MITWGKDDTMTVGEIKSLLKSLAACTEATRWADGKDLKTIWDTCERPDWLLWLAGRMEGQPGWPDRKAIVASACDCAELALPYVKKGETRPADCLRTVRAWLRGEATMEQVYKARRDANAASAYAAYASAYAAASASASAVYVSAAYAASAGTSAADAASASAAASAAAVKSKCLEILRSNLRPDGAK